MWCSECQADVSPSPDALSSCGRCGSRLRIAGDATIREARDIISRWSSSDMLDRITSLPPIPQVSSGLASSAAGRGNSSGGSGSQSESEQSDHLARDSESLGAEFSDRRQSEQGFDDEEPQDDFDQALIPDQPQEDHSHSVLADLDHLARQANVKPSDSERPSDAYLKLSEMDRPTQENPTVDTTELKLKAPSAAQPGTAQPNTAASKPLDADTVLQQLTGNLAELNDSAKQGPEDSKSQTISMEQSPPFQPVKSIAAEGPPVEKSLADAPSLSSLLKQSNSESVGQLAFAIHAKQQQDEQQKQTLKTISDVQKAEAPNDEGHAFVAKFDSKHQPTHSNEEGGLTRSEPNGAEKDAKSLQAESTSQLGSGPKQTKTELDSEGRTESEESPAHLTTSDQVASKSSATKFSETQSTETAANEPILPEREDGTDQSDTHPVPTDNQRVVQPRKAQRRKQHPRQLKQSASILDGDDQKGMNTVSRKYRVDNPNQESVEPAMASAQQNASAGNSNSNSNGRRFRIDSAESMDGMLDTADSRVRTQGRSRQRYIDEPHGNAIRGPHFEVVGKKRSNMASMTGQFLAYLGVLGLTVGTAIVIYGHFGGMSEYTPTGWLVTTVAQMMLFLGVINLVSGGIEQNNDDVSVRINTLGEQLMRIEQVTEQALRGPKISASRYADPDSAPEESRTRKSVEINK